MKTRKQKEYKIKVKKKADIFTSLQDPLTEVSVYDSGFGRELGIALECKGGSSVYLTIKPKQAKKFAESILKIAKRVSK